MQKVLKEMTQDFTPTDFAESQIAGARGFDRVKLIGIAAAFAAGLVLAFQGHINGSLSVQLGNGIAAATYAFGSALVVLTLLLLASPAARAALGRVLDSVRSGIQARRLTGDANAPLAGLGHPGTPGIGRLRWFQIIGGAAGGLFVLSQSVTVPIFGVALFVVALTAGQTVSSLFCDRFGFAPGGKRPITWLRALGPLIAIAAVLVAQWRNLGNPDHLGFVLLPVIAGIFVAAQHAINGRVEATAAYHPAASGMSASDQPASGITNEPRMEHLAGALTATFINFAVGTAALILVLAVALAIQGAPAGPMNFQWWMFTGGLLGMIFIGTAAVVVPRIGALLWTLALIAGQTLGGLVLDLTVRHNTPALATYLGVLLILLAVAIPALTTRSADA